MEDLKTKPNKYEIMYIVDDQNQENAQKIKRELVEILVKNGGKIIKEQDSIRQFVYPINKKVKGHYFIIEVLTWSDNIANFKRVALIKKQEIIRFLVINLDKEKINKFKVKPQMENNSFSRPVRPGNRSTYKREENAERKPRPIAGTESSYRAKNNYQNIKSTSNTSTEPKD